MNFGPTGKRPRSRRRFANLRYRLYVAVVALLLLFTVGSDTYNIAPVNLSIFSILSQNPLAVEVKQGLALEEKPFLHAVINNNVSKVFLDPTGKTIQEGAISATDLNILQWPVVDLASGQGKGKSEKPTLDELIAPPLNPEKVDILEYPDYGIVAPIKYTTERDIYDENGNPYTDKGDVGNPCSYDATNTPVQLKLKEGIVHMYFSPKPGELPDPKKGTFGSSYIVGHSSDCTRHAYSTIFKALDRNSQPGQMFYIYDSKGRKLTFRVFQVERILDSQTDIAYEDFGEKRVVTLQTSIFVSNYQIDRWLTRGELVVD